MLHEIDNVIAAVALFLAWFEMTFMLGRFPSIGMYTYLSWQIVKQLVPLVSIVFGTTIISISMAFYLLLARDLDVFDSPWVSILRVNIQMMEILFTNNFSRF